MGIRGWPFCAGDGPSSAKGSRLVSFTPRARLINAVSNSGWAGVDLFFVLSGFLITGILWETRGQPNYFRNFYVRRGLRIFPLYYTYLLIYALLSMAWPKTIGPATHAHESLWAAFYGTNILIAVQQAVISPALTHFWTLAIEEHFYLVWPLLIYLVPARRMVWVCGGFVLAAILMRVAFWMHSDIYAACMFSACRMDGFAIGGLAAILCRQSAAIASLLPTARWTALVAFAVLGASLARHDGLEWGSGFMLSAGLTLLALFFASCILVQIHGDRRMKSHRLLTAAPLRFFGKYSYGLYVLHIPIQLVVNHWMRNMAGPSYEARPVMWMFFNSMAIVVLSIAAAWLSWRLLENPFLQLKRYFAPRPGEVVAAEAENVPSLSSFDIGKRSSRIHFLPFS